MSMHWIDVGPAETLGKGEAVEVLAEGQIVAIFRTEEGLFAIDGMCAHQGGPIAEGTVENGCVTCPWHGWQYELATGIQTINLQPLQRTFPVRERAGRLELGVESSERPNPSQ